MCTRCLKRIRESLEAFEKIQPQLDDLKKSADEGNIIAKHLYDDWMLKKELLLDEENVWLTILN